MNWAKVVKSREHLKTLAKQVEDALSCQRKVGGQREEYRFEQAEYKVSAGLPPDNVGETTGKAGLELGKFGLWQHTYSNWFFIICEKFCEFSDICYFQEDRHFTSVCQNQLTYFTKGEDLLLQKNRTFSKEEAGWWFLLSFLTWETCLNLRINIREYYNRLSVIQKKNLVAITIIW